MDRMNVIRRAIGILGKLTYENCNDTDLVRDFTWRLAELVEFDGCTEMLCDAYDTFGRMIFAGSRRYYSIFRNSLKSLLIQLMNVKRGV